MPTPQEDRQVSAALVFFWFAVAMAVGVWMNSGSSSATARQDVRSVQTADAPDAPDAASSDTGRATAAAVAADETKRVLVISIDGLRPDLALLTDMPNLRSLMKDGAYSMWAQTLTVGITLPSHTSMMTGTPPERHGVFWNDDTPLRKRRYDYPHVPTLFEWAKEKNPAYTTALVAGKYKFAALARPGSVDYLVLPEQPKRIGPDGKELPAVKPDDEGLTPYNRRFSDDWVGEQAATVIREHQPHLMLVHFGRVDSVGHAKGWGSPQQMAAIVEADKALGKVLAALRETGDYDSTLIILTSDHGGYGKGHDGKDPRGLHIPWIIHGPGIRKGYDLTQNRLLIINTMDTFGTAASYLGLTFSSEDGVEGKAVKDAFEPVVKPAAPTPATTTP